jgi:hypothetical protein
MFVEITSDIYKPTLYTSSAILQFMIEVEFFNQTYFISHRNLLWHSEILRLNLARLATIP